VLTAEAIPPVLLRLLAPASVDGPAPGRRTAVQDLARWRAALPRPSTPALADRAYLREGGNCSNAGCEFESAGRRYSLWLELAEACNLDCLFCYNPWRPADSSLRGRPTLDAATLTRTVTLIMERLDIDYVTLSGGEPLLYRSLPELIALVRSRCPSIGMTTNGRSLTRRRLATLVAEGLGAISVPLHSHRPEVHDALAGGTSWASAVRALALGREAGLTVSMSCVVTARNSADVPSVVEAAGALGIGTIILNCFHRTGQGAGRTDLDIAADRFDAIVDATREQAGPGVSVVIGSPSVPGPGAPGRSRNTVNRVVVSPYGDLKLCNQSTGGVATVTEDPQGALDGILAALADGSYADYLPRIDNCSCIGTA
jgi:sulfatase maturation enzyme AslB (radical SAM superfamily)